MIRRAVSEFKHRLTGPGVSSLITNRIEDDINVYIQYILTLNTIIQNILTTMTVCCPLQIDMVILGREHKRKAVDDDAKNADADDEDDDDELLAAMEIKKRSITSHVNNIVLKK